SYFWTGEQRTASQRSRANVTSSLHPGNNTAAKHYLGQCLIANVVLGELAWGRHYVPDELRTRVGSPGELWVPTKMADCIGGSSNCHTAIVAARRNEHLTEV